MPTKSPNHTSNEINFKSLTEVEILNDRLFKPAFLKIKKWHLDCSLSERSAFTRIDIHLNVPAV